MLLEPANAVLRLADQHPVPDGGGVIFDQGAANADDLLAGFFLHIQQVGSEVGPQRVQVGLGRHLLARRFQLVLHGLNIRLQASYFGPESAQELQNEIVGLLSHEFHPEFSVGSPRAFFPILYVTATILSITAIAGLAIEDVDRDYGDSDYGDSAFYWHPPVRKESAVLRRYVVNRVGEESSGGIFAKGSEVDSTAAAAKDADEKVPKTTRMIRTGKIAEREIV